MRVALRLEGALRPRVVRVLNAQRGVRVVPLDDGDDVDLVVGGEGVPVPDHPMGHLLELLGRHLEDRSEEPPTMSARTVEGTTLASGIAVPYPPPVGPLWSRLDNGVALSPTKSSFAGVLVRNEALTLAVVDERPYLEALIAAGPALAEIASAAELPALLSAGLTLAELH